MNSLFQLEIPKRSTQCAHQGERLLPGMDIYSLLIEEENSPRLVRRDFCLACWTQVGSSQCEQLLARGYWKSKIEKRKVPEGSSRVERALALLCTLQQAVEPPEAEIFVLCLFLSHARQLALRQEFQQEGLTYHLYEILRKEEFFTVKVIHLSQMQIEGLQKTLADQLQNREDYATRH
jgi:hypothetical protein